ncbi:hypothetical protein RB653_009693 [Dictyostelium firmibasis]|uniref:Mitofilin n=1 Tax=Dictyostelium firmibasis TaxID=79012 RepID=A0AAN7TST7_9MYCE
MSFLKLSINKTVLKSTSILKVSSRTRFNNNNTTNKENKYEKRYYSSFSMKEDPKPSKPFSFKPLIGLALVGGIGAYLYQAWDNQDFMFSSKLPYQREEVEKFKIIMRELKEEADKSKFQMGEQKQEELENNRDDNNIVLTKQSNEEDTSTENQEDKKHEMVSLIESAQDNSNSNNNNNNNNNDNAHRSTDEINADERDLDSETLNITDEISKLIEEHRQSEEENPSNTTNDNTADVVETIAVIVTPDEPINHIILVEKEEEKEKEEESLSDLLDINYSVLSIIPEKVKSAEEKVENVLKKFEEQYLEKVERLIHDNLKIKAEFDSFINGKDDEVKRLEDTIRGKYRDSLDLAIEELNRDLDEKLKDMDSFIKTKVNDNQTLLQETLEKQKANLINIFKQQSESIKQSELEKRAITQLTQCIVDLQKLLNNQSSIDGTKGTSLLGRSFKNLSDLSNYDQLIKELLSTLPEGFEKKPIIAIDTLNKEFQEIAKKLRKSQLLDPNDNSLVGKAVSELASFFIIPEKGMVQGSNYDAILARTEDYLRKGNLSSAIKEMESIQQQSSKTTNINDHHLSKLTSSWIGQAKERDQLENISKLLELKLELIQKQQQQIKEQQQKHQK